ncbi:hypothetical protein NKH85_31425 [Mesorhizobium sp. M0924]|uniref:hypothetical protein n=1 Tax=unclassified Mesorhizobium TaxID=325217 RepID=UPI0003CEF853|nr:MULTISPECIES: hypothetical protein [unclassified Mesorhizobium]ESX22498.1 hypothetical protein X765_30410 [Mesorhizobium sp. LSHC440B00]ESX33563.1 hypothetical protein X764_29615 [Mesorhizobium sp. LSHC440A00]ESZ38237.1 hypothetical protein X731_29105 [Mesorhizobium sp. L2C054A000]
MIVFVTGWTLICAESGTCLMQITMCIGGFSRLLSGSGIAVISFVRIIRAKSLALPLSYNFGWLLLTALW